MARSKKLVVDLKVLPGEPLDGTGRICIHLFVQDQHGLFTEPHVIHPVFENGVQGKQKVECRPTRGRLACNRKRGVAPTTRNGVTTVTPRTDDPRAVTCSKCIASKEYIELMRLNTTTPPSVVTEEK